MWLEGGVSIAGENWKVQQAQGGQGFLLPGNPTDLPAWAGPLPPGP